MATNKQNTPLVNKVVKYSWIIFISSIVGIWLLFFTIAHNWFGKLPNFEELENPKSFLATEVLATNGEVLGKYYQENRSKIEYKDLSPYIINALVATEDIRFEKHAGIDMRALGRVLKGVLTFNLAGGGSTISQQLAKNLFKTRRQKIAELQDLGILPDEYKQTLLEKLINKNSKIRAVFAKLKEWVIAVRLEKSYTKQEIMTMYLNTVEFNDGAFGIKSASKTYFNKLPNELNIQEAAVLVGMLKAPSAYNPRRNPIDSKDRRNTVFGQMQRYGFISETEEDSLDVLPIILDFKRSTHTGGLAPYFREHLRGELKQIFATTLPNGDLKYTKPNGDPYNIYTDGLKIYTTIDPKLQQYAEEAVNEHLSNWQAKFLKHWKDKDPWNHNGKDYTEELEKAYVRSTYYNTLKSEGITEDSIQILLDIPQPFTIFTWDGEKDTVMTPKDYIKHNRMFLQTGFMAIDPKNGYIKAWVGGINYKHFQFDHVKSKRQIGSTFKPFIYIQALIDRAYSPCFPVPNEQVTFPANTPPWNILKEYSPKNPGGYGGILTIQEGLATSNNNITAYLMQKMSPQSIHGFVADMGITSKISDGPAICLGVDDISLFEMLGAYTVYANNGFYSKPVFISRIENASGVTIYQSDLESREVLTKEWAYVVTRLLQGVVDIGGGTGNRLRWMFNIPRSLEIAGKTGTTQNNSDGWFIGYTPDILAGAWVGCEDRFVRFRNADGQGARMAMPIWAKFANKLYGDSTLTEYNYNSKFEKIKTDELPVELDCSEFTDSNNSPANDPDSETIFD